MRPVCRHYASCCVVERIKALLARSDPWCFGHAQQAVGLFMSRSRTWRLQPAMLAALSSLVACAATAQDVTELSPRVQKLLEQMTLEEKLGMVQGSRDPAYGGGAGYIAGAPRLDVPPLRMADGPSNVYVRYETTALPQPITLAATFSTTFAEQYGQVLGRESRAT